MANTISLEALRGSVGQRQAPSRWYRLDADRVQAFADRTEDWQYIHLDAERAAQTPFGGPVAHGFLTLSMLSAMSYDVLAEPEGTQMSVNYGFDKLRFIAPVPVGARIRGHFTLQGLKERRAGEIMCTHQVEVEIEGGDRPALAAEWLNLFVLQET